MKVRSGFVANSSSSSFIVAALFNNNDLSELVLDAKKQLDNINKINLEKADKLDKLINSTTDYSKITHLIDGPIADIINDGTDYDTDDDIDDIETIDINSTDEIISRKIYVTDSKELRKAIYRGYFESTLYSIHDKYVRANTGAIRDLMEQNDIDKNDYEETVKRLYQALLHQIKQQNAFFPLYAYVESIDLSYYDDFKLEDVSEVINYCMQKDLIVAHECICSCN